MTRREKLRGCEGKRETETGFVKYCRTFIGRDEKISSVLLLIFKRDLEEKKKEKR